MKTLKQIIIVVVFVLIQLSAMAQPLPPQNPDDIKPVPIGAVPLVLLVSMAATAVLSLKKRQIKE